MKWSKRSVAAALHDTHLLLLADCLNICYL